MHARLVRQQLQSLSTKMKKMRKELLATKQGNITGEVRLREKLGEIYGDVMSYQGRPTNSQVTRLENLANEVKIQSENAGKRSDLFILLKSDYL